MVAEKRERISKSISDKLGVKFQKNHHFKQLAARKRAKEEQQKRIKFETRMEKGEVNSKAAHFSNNVRAL